MTLQEQANKLGISRQAVWQKTEKGKAWQKTYNKEYQKTDKRKSYIRVYHLKNKDKILAQQKVYKQKRKLNNYIS